MCPLNTSPQRGYADWGRVEDYDSGPLYSVNRVANANTETTPIIDVSRWAYLGGVDGVNSTDVVATLAWYIDAAATVQVGIQTFTISGLLSNFPQYRIPNLGPFLRITWTAIGGGNFGHIAVLFGTNRVHPLTFVPVTPQLVNISNAAIGIGASQTWYPFSYYAGPMLVLLLSTQAPVTFSLQRLDSSGLWLIVDNVNPLANTYLSWKTLAPQGAWRIVASNLSGALANYYLEATPSATGAT